MLINQQTQQTTIANVLQQQQQQQQQQQAQGGQPAPPPPPPAGPPPNINMILQMMNTLLAQQLNPPPPPVPAPPMACLKVALPNQFSGTITSAHTFLEECDNYFVLNQMGEEQKIRFTLQLLTGDAAMKSLSGSRARKFQSVPMLHGISGQVLRLV
jgi:hypothetical protein